MRKCCLLATVVLSLVASQAIAETAPSAGPGPLSKTFPCDAFVKNPDGSWTPIRDVNIELPDRDRMSGPS